MLLGKRHRQQSMRRTTSLTELSSNHLPMLEPDLQASPEPHHSPMEVVVEPAAPPPAQRPAVVGGGSVADGNRPPQLQGRQQKEKGPRLTNPSPSDDWLVLGLLPPAAPPRVSRRNSGDFSGVEPANFLRACGLCRRRLGPGRDTYMYRGEIAFCSLECRQQQMALDERKDKCSRTANGTAEQATAATGAKTSATTTAAAARTAAAA